MNTLYVATIGGHIAELVELADRIPREGERLWVTNDNDQTRDLLAGEPVELVPYIGERAWREVLREVPRARRILRERGIRRVVSTGSAIALAYLPVAASMGIEAHYIESSTRVESISVSGRLLARTPGVRCWWQFATPPAGFHHIGGVYDGFVAAERPRGADLERVVVTVGTTDHDFRRLIARLVEIIPPGVEVLWQTGRSTVDDLPIDAKRMVPQSVLTKAIDEADVLVTHAGTGSLALALQAGKVPVFVPRRASFKEHLDDHQLELATWAHSVGLAIHVEADQIQLTDLEAAAGLHVSHEPAGELLLV